MNELQQKLARRRNLNGETDAAPGAPPTQPKSISVPKEIERVEPNKTRAYSSAAVVNRNSISSVDPAARDTSGEPEVEEDEWGDSPPIAAPAHIALSKPPTAAEASIIPDSAVVNTSASGGGYADSIPATADEAAVAKKAEEEVAAAAAKRAADEAAVAKKAEEEAAVAAAKRAADEAAVAKKAEKEAAASAQKSSGAVVDELEEFQNFLEDDFLAPQSSKVALAVPDGRTLSGGDDNRRSALSTKRGRSSSGAREKSFDLFGADDGEDDGERDEDFFSGSAELTELAKANTLLRSQISQIQTDLRQKQDSILSLTAGNQDQKEEMSLLSAQMQKLNNIAGSAKPVVTPGTVPTASGAAITDTVEEGLFSLSTAPEGALNFAIGDVGAGAADTLRAAAPGLTGAADINKRLKAQLSKLEADLGAKEQALIRLSTEGSQQKRAIDILKARLAKTVVVPSLYSNRPVSIPTAVMDLTPPKAPAANKSSVLKSAKKLGFDQSKLSDAIFSMQEDELFATGGLGASRKSGTGSGADSVAADAADVLFSSPSGGGRPTTKATNDLAHLLSRSSLMNDKSSTRASELSNQLNRHGLFGDDTGGDSQGGGGSNNMFRDDDMSKSQKPASTAREGKSTKDLDFEQFVDLLVRSEENRYLSDAIKKFIMATLGPHGDGSPPTAEEELICEFSYKFRGAEDLAKRYGNFTDDLVAYMGEQPQWQHIVDDEDELMVIQNHLETYIVSFIADLAFTSVTDTEEDEKLFRRMRLLSTFIEPEVLGINPAVRNDMVWAMAQDSLRKMHSLKMPAEKVACVVKCASILFRSLNLARVNTEAANSSGASAGVDPLSAPGADDFLPVFIYVVLKSNVAKLYSNCEFIQYFLNSSQLRSQSGYFFISLRSALEFIMNLDAESINMDPEVFDKKLAEAEKLI